MVMHRFSLFEIVFSMLYFIRLWCTILFLHLLLHALCVGRSFYIGLTNRNVNERISHQIEYERKFHGTKQLRTE